MDGLLAVLRDILANSPPFFDGFIGGVLGSVLWTLLHDRWRIVRRKGPE